VHALPSPANAVAHHKIMIADLPECLRTNVPLPDPFGLMGQRVDIMLLSMAQKRMLTIELIVPMEENIAKQHKTKGGRYEWMDKIDQAVLPHQEYRASIASLGERLDERFQIIERSTVSADCPSVASRLPVTLIPELRYPSVSCMGLGHQHHWAIRGNRVD
jgi:hypothetical protein